MNNNRLEQIVEKELSSQSIRSEVVQWYVAKFKTKMSGSSFSSAKGWVKGIGTQATEEEKAEILKQIDPYIDYHRR